MLASTVGLLSACAVHQWPDEPTAEAGEAILTLRLKFHPEMTVWEHYYDIDTKRLTEVAADVTYDNTQPTGFMRYIIRIYPRSEVRRAAMWHLQEYIFTREFTGGDYDFQTDVSLPYGEYTLLAWADIATDDRQDPIYDATDFAAVELTDHRVCDDYRDAFRGVLNIAADRNTAAAAAAGTPVEVCVDMQRPLAKFEIVAEGIEDFIRANPTRSLSDYKVILAYTQWTPYLYSLPDDQPTNSHYQLQFATGLTAVDDSSASMGFDYFITRNERTSTRVQVGVFDAAGNEVAMSEQFEVPLQRDRHTVIRGKFMAAHASGGMVGLDPGFDGDWNIVM